MTLQTTNIARVFKYNGMTLRDPAPSKTPDQVKSFFSSQYPELTNAVIEGPNTKGVVATYTFARAAGSKGAARPASQATILHRIVADGLPNDGSPLHGVTILQLQENCKCSQIAQAVMNNRSSLTPILPLAGAYSRFG